MERKNVGTGPTVNRCASLKKEKYTYETSYFTFNN